MLSANFWQDKNNSKIIVKKKNFFEDLINSLNSSIKKLKSIFNYSKHFKNVNLIFGRVFN